MVSLTDKEDKLARIAAQEILAEFLRARKKFPPMRGPHEGYAIILEELDELWDAVKSHNMEDARLEAVQVAAMALAFMIEVSDG